MSQQNSNSILIDSLTIYIPPIIVRAIHANQDQLRKPHVDSFFAAVLSVDISGLNTIAEQLTDAGHRGIEELVEILNGYYTRVFSLIEKEGGEIVHFSSNSLLATFSTTSDPPADAVRRAWQAADQMRQTKDEISTIETTVGSIMIGMKVGLGVGLLRTFSVGGILDRWLHIIAGNPLRQVATLKQIAHHEDVLLSPEAQALWSDTALESPPSLALSWSDVDDTLIATLRAHIPETIRGQTNNVPRWLAELRLMSVVSLKMYNLSLSDPKALIRVQSIVTALQEIVYSYEGSINKVLTDDMDLELIVLFGAPPFAHTDDALRAVRFASSIYEASKILQLRISVGVATGQVFAGPVGSPTRCEYLVMGNAVDRAARLMKSSTQGFITADLATAQATSAEIEWEQLLSRVKGRSVVSAFQFKINSKYEPLEGGSSEQIAHIAPDLTASINLLLSLSGPRQSLILRRCAVPRYFDASVLALLREREDGSEQVFAALANYSFVRSIGKHAYTYHDDVRAVLLQTWRNEPREEWQRLQLMLAEYAVCRQQATDNIDERRRWLWEALYHQLLAEPEVGSARLLQARAEATAVGDLAALDALRQVEADAVADQIWES